MSILFAFPKNKELAETLSAQTGFKLGALAFRHFPDGETYLRFETEVRNQDVILVCNLDQPDSSILPILFFAETALELGALSVGLVTPYLGYMRQDKRFQPGEAVTSVHFAKLLSQHIDWLVTIDPHLHRHKSLRAIYSVPAFTIHATDSIACWILENIDRPLLLGPDQESEQWVAQVAELAHAPYQILSKTRKGDKEVEITLPDLKSFSGYTPVILDDVIASACTVIQAVEGLKAQQMNPPVCIGIHALFAEDAYEALQAAGPHAIVTCNTVPHPTNKIDLSPLLATILKNVCGPVEPNNKCLLFAEKRE